MSASVKRQRHVKPGSDSNKQSDTQADKHTEKQPDNKVISESLKSDKRKKERKEKLAEVEKSKEEVKGSLLSRACMRCIHTLKYLLIILIIPPFLNYAALVQESSQLLPQVGALYDIGRNQKLYLGCQGVGLPTVILDAPTGLSSDVWSLVVGEVSKLTKVCVYDRAGLGFSDRPFYNYSANEEAEKKKDENRWQPFTVERMVDDLHRLVTYSSQQPRPLLLVGAEMGGLVARFYTQLYESDVSDVVLIDPLADDLFSYEQNVWSLFWSQHLIPSFQSMQLAAAVGLARLALLIGLLDQPITGSTTELPIDVIRRQKHLLCSPRHLSSVVDEHFFINESFSQIRTVFTMKSFPRNVSVTVVNGNYYDEQLPSSVNKAWASAQKNLVTRQHPGSSHLIVNGADHHMLYRRPSAIIEPIARLVRQWRTKQNLA